MRLFSLPSVYSHTPSNFTGHWTLCAICLMSQEKNKHDETQYDAKARSHLQ